MNPIKEFLKKSDKISRLYREVRDHLDRNKPLYQTPWGFRMSGHESMATGNFEQEETKVIRKILSHTDLFVNAGANVGYYVCHALSLGKEVIAIEPVQRNLHYLMKNIHVNGWGNDVEIFPVAAGEKTDVMPIWGGKTGASLIEGWASNPKNYVNFVPVHSLDRVLSGRSENKQLFILVDVEGFEYQLLKGAKKLLYHEPKPVWMIEITKTENHPNKLGNPFFLKTFQMFFDAGYRAFKGNLSREELTREEVIALDQGELTSTCINYIFQHGNHRF